MALRFWRFVSVCCLALVGQAPATFAASRDLAGELAGAQTALAASQYDRAYQAYLEHSDDNPLAQFTLGLFHQYGWGRPTNLIESCRWEERAANGGIPLGQQMLADCLRHGVHRPVDLPGAARWYEQAAASGSLFAKCLLAELYMSGEGVAKDPGKALRLCKQSAEKGLPAAQLRLARFYLEGDSSVRDPVVALQWTKAAAQANNADAEYQLGLMLRDGTGQASDLVAARWWLEMAASQGWRPAYQPTAELYFRTDGEPGQDILPETDLAKAYLWSSAAVKCLPEGRDLEQAKHLLAEIVSRMPFTWRVDLDQKVAEHLARVSAATNVLPTSKATSPSHCR